MPVPSFKHPFGIRHELFGDTIFEHLMPSRFPSRVKFGGCEPFEVTQTCGCFMLFRASQFWEVGGFDINLFLYYEEFDICLRLRNKGWKCMVLPAFRFKHIHGASTKRSAAIAKELYISKLYCYHKHHGIILSWLFRLINLLILLFKPHKWHVLPVILHGESICHSMRHTNYNS